MDDTAEKKVGSMEVEMPHLLPVSASATVAARPVAVLFVSMWALITPFGLFLYYGIWAVLTSALSTFFRQTDAEVEADEASALDIGIACCAALQAAASVLAMQLPCRRVWVRYAFAYLALALTIAGHWMYFAHGSLFPSADPGPGDCFSNISCTVAVVLCAVGDILYFVVLLLGPLLGDEDELNSSAKLAAGDQRSVHEVLTSAWDQFMRCRLVQLS